MSVRQDLRWRRPRVPVAAFWAAEVRRVPVGCLRRTIALTRLVESSIVDLPVLIPGIASSRHQSAQLGRDVTVVIPSAQTGGPVSVWKVRDNPPRRCVIIRPVTVAMTTLLCFHLYAGPSSKCVAGNTVTELHHA